MISWTIFLLTTLAVILFQVCIGFKRKWQRSPPGPKGLPIFGNLFQIEKLQHQSFSKWAKDFGPIFKIQLANLKMIVVSDHKMVKEMFSKSVFSGRLDLTFADFFMDGNLHGIGKTEGPRWEEVRLFTLRQLRDFGFGKHTMQDLIMIEVTEFIELMVETKGEPVRNVKDRLIVAVLNSLWFISTGTRHRQNDPELVSLAKKVGSVLQEAVEGGGIVLFLPRLAKWFPKLSGYTTIRNKIQEFAATFQKSVDEHIKTYSANYARDFSDVFLKQIYATKNPKSAFYGKLGEQNLVATLGDLFFAGGDTTSTTLSWMMIYLSKHLEVQKKFHNEIEFITGNRRPCAVSDRSDMPYTEAMIAETMRFSSIFPGGLMHKVMADTEYKGYFLPKDTIISHNAYYIHHDPEIWGDPEQFRPERFLSPDGKTFKKHEALMPFSTGRRQCLGETLARDTLFLFSTNVFQRFTVGFDRNGPESGLEPEPSIVLTPKPFSLIFKDRNDIQGFK